MKLDASALRYIHDSEWRVLTAIEMGMKNHEIVPTKLVSTLAGLKLGGVGKGIGELHRYKLLHHESQPYDGYRLTPLGYDFLALRALSRRGRVLRVGKSLGVGKEADVYEVEGDDGKLYAMKIHRLGRTSFRAVKNKRDYLKHRKSASWIYMSRLAAFREWTHLRALHRHEFPVPFPVDWNRHVVIMGLIPGIPLSQVRDLSFSTQACAEMLQLCCRLAQHGLVHGDLNEFNILVSDEAIEPGEEVRDYRLWMIDFPQMISVSHENAEETFDRDVSGIVKYFVNRFSVPEEDIEIPAFNRVMSEDGALVALDVEVEASGYSKQDGVRLRSALLRGSDSHDIDRDDEEPKSCGDSTEEETEGDGELDEANSSDSSLVAECKPFILECEEGKEHDRQIQDEHDDGDIETHRPTSVHEQGNASHTRGFDRSHVALLVKRERQKAERKAISRRNVTKDKQKQSMKAELSGSSFWG